MSQFDVIIIGSGISSLTSAALLSKKGKRVLVLEQYSKPGGYLHSFKRFGEIYDTGAHYVGALNPGQPFHTLLNYLDVYDSNIFSPLDKTGFDVFKFPEGAVQIPVGYENVIEELGSIFPNEKSAIRNYFSMIKDVVRFFPTYNFSDKIEMTASLEAIDVSLKSVVEKLTQNPRLQSVFYSYCVLHGVHPEDVPFGFHAIMVDSLVIGPMGFAQGGDELAKKYVERIEAQGGKVLVKKKVTGLEVENDQIKTVRTEDGDIFSADWVISGIHPKATFRLLSDNSKLTPAFKERITNLRESEGIFGVYATCKGLEEFNSKKNYYYFRTSDPKSLFDFGGPGDVPPAVFMSRSRVKTKNEGSQVLSLHSVAPYRWFEKWKDTPYGKRPDDYKQLKEVVTNKIFGLVGHYEEGFRAKVDKYVTSSPLTNLHYNGSEEGSGYGIYHSMQNTGARALGPRTKILNLLLTGQNCLFPGLLGSSVSALRTCGHIIGIKPVLAELNELGKKS